MHDSQADVRSKDVDHQFGVSIETGRAHDTSSCVQRQILLKRPLQMDDISVTMA